MYQAFLDLNFIVLFFASALILLPHYIRGGSREAWGRGYNYILKSHLNTILCVHYAVILIQAMLLIGLIFIKKMTHQHNNSYS